MDFGIWETVLNFVAGVLPSSDGLPTAMESAIQIGYGYLVTWNGLMPVDEFLTIIKFVIVFEIGVFIFGIFRWTINVIRGSGA